MENTKTNKKNKNSTLSFKRINKLVRLQMSEKFRAFKTNSVKAFVFSFGIKIALVVGFSLLLSFLFKSFVQLSLFTVDENTLAVFLGIITLVTAISSLSSVFKNLYSVKDNQFLYTLPATHTEVLVSKLIITFLSEIVSSIMFSLPFIVSFGLLVGNVDTGIFVGATAALVLSSIFVLIVLPIIVMLLATLLSMPLLLLKNFISKYTTAKVIFWIVMFVLVLLGFNWILNIAISNFSLLGQWLQLSYTLKLSFANFANDTWIFLQIAKMFAGINAGWVVLAMLGTIVVLGVLTFLLVKPFYYKMSVWEISKHRKIVSKNKIKPISNSFLAVTRKNLWLLLQNPTTLLSYFTGLIALPFIVLLVNKFMNAMYLREFGYMLLFGGNLAIITLFSLIGCSYAGSGVSQEGSNYYMLKSSPVLYRTQAISKISINLVINSISIVVSAVIAAWTTALTFWQGFYIVFASILISLAHMCVLFALDFAKPSVDWKDVGEFKKSKSTNRVLTLGVIVGLIFAAFTFKFLFVSTYIRMLIYMVILSAIYLGYGCWCLYTKLKYEIQ